MPHYSVEGSNHHVNTSLEHSTQYSHISLPHKKKSISVSSPTLKLQMKRKNERMTDVFYKDQKEKRIIDLFKTNTSVVIWGNL